MASSYTSPLDRKKNEDMAIKHEVLDDGSSLEVDTGQSIVNENGAVNNRTFLNLNCDARVENMNAHFGRNTVVNDTIVVEHSTTYRGCNNQRNLSSVKGGSSQRITIASVSINDGEDEGNVIPAEDKNAVCSAVKREDETRRKEITMGYDFPDGSIISKAFWDDADEELIKWDKLQLYSLNQQPGNEGRFLKMVLDTTGLKVNTNGVRQDPYTLWLAHYTLNEQRCQVVIFENEKCSKMTKKKCVLYTQYVKESEDYILIGKEIDQIPERLRDIDPFIGFLKYPKATGSELLFLKSMLTTKEKPLLVGFDGVGQSIPLNKVKKYSPDFQAFFRIIEAG